MTIPLGLIIGDPGLTIRNQTLFDLMADSTTNLTYHGSTTDPLLLHRNRSRSTEYIIEENDRKYDYLERRLCGDV